MLNTMIGSHFFDRSMRMARRDLSAYRITFVPFFYDTVVPPDSCKVFAVAINQDTADGQRILSSGYTINIGTERQVLAFLNALFDALKKLHNPLETNNLRRFCNFDIALSKVARQ